MSKMPKSTRKKTVAQMYEKHYGDGKVQYAYGEPWIAMALFIGDIKFDTKQEAINWWEVNYGYKTNSGDAGEEDEIFYGNETSTF